MSTPAPASTPRPTSRYRIWEPFGYPSFVLDQAITADMAALNLPAGAKVLDYGCGVRPYQDAFGEGVEYIGADLPGNDQADIEIHDGVVDLPDASVDVVFSTQVLEHVLDPAAYLAECRRLLKPGGRLLMSTHGTMFFHPHPTDLWRWTHQGLERIVEQAGFKDIQLQSLMGAVPLALWFILLNLQANLPPGVRHLVVAFFNVLIRWTNRFTWTTFRTDFVYVVNART